MESPYSSLSNVWKELVESLHILTNSSFSDGIFLSKLKSAKVSPLFKKVEKLSINNYQPPPLLPVFSKVHSGKL